MPLPAWLREAHPHDLHARVENLPLERLTLGRRALNAYRHGLSITALTVGLNALLLAIAEGVVLTGRSLTHLLLLLVVLTGTLALPYSVTAVHTLHAAWTTAQRDPLPRSIHLCDTGLAGHLRAGLIFNAVVAALLWVLYLAFGQGHHLFELSTPPLSYLIIYMLVLPTSMARSSSELYRGLTGLLKGTPRRAAVRKAVAARLPELLRSPAPQRSS